MLLLLMHNTAVCIELNAHSTVKIQLALDGCDSVTGKYVCREQL
mgnify:CR=1 FL=1